MPQCNRNIPEQRKGIRLMALNKADLVDSVSNQVALPKNQSTLLIEPLLEIIKHAFSCVTDALVK